MIPGTAFIKNEDGIAATEFALMAPVLLLMLIGIFDYGMYLNTMMKLENTSFTAAQYIVQGGDPDNIEQDVILASNLGVTADTLETLDIDVDYFYECADTASVEAGTDCGEDDYLREFVQVTISMDYETILPYPGIPSAVNLSGRVRLQNG